MTDHIRYCLLILILSSFAVTGAYSQNIIITGKVTDSLSGRPLAFVNVVSDDNIRAVLSDMDGSFRISVSEKSQMLKFTYVGYFSKMLATEQQGYIQVKMKPRCFELSEVVIFPAENPAHRIIKKLIQNKDINDPLKQTSFTYRAYNKFFINPDEDQLRKLADSLPSDTAVQKIRSYAGRQYIFLMESLSERRYRPPDKSSETILACKVSGFKDPLFTLLMTQVQSFTFYDDFISIFGVSYVNPVSSGSMGKYFFQIEDTLYQDRDSVYVISFRPFKNTGFTGLKGLLYVNTDGYAIQNVIAESANLRDNYLKIQQMYRKIEGRQWFPVQLNTDITMNMMQISGLRVVGSGKTYIEDIVLDTVLRNNSFGNASVDVDIEALENPDHLLDKYRLNKPGEKDSLTYIKLDSIGKKYKLDRRLGNLNTILNGKIPIGFVDIDINKLLDFNRYESVRIGLGLRTNLKVSKIFSVGLYAAYGFGDNKLKYGGDVEFRLHKRSSTFLKVYYFDDIAETGKYEFAETASLFSSEWLRTVCLDRFDSYRRTGLDVFSHPMPSLQVKAGLSISNIKSLYDYRFYRFSDDSSSKRIAFRDVAAAVSIRFAFGERFIRNVDYEMAIKNEKAPVILFTYIHGFRNIAGGCFLYNKINLKIRKTIHHKYIGKSGLTLIAAFADRSLPLALLYSVKGTQDAYFFQINETFTTMNSDEFYSDILVSLSGRHEFPGIFKKHTWFDPKVNILLSAGWGKLHNSGYHMLAAVKSPDKVYAETGLILNDLLNVKYISLGLGVFYRFGYYSSVHEKDNFFPCWNLKIKIQG